MRVIGPGRARLGRCTRLLFSALSPQRSSWSTYPDVRFAPKSDRLLRCREVTLCAKFDQSAPQQNWPLFNHPVREGKQRRWDVEA